MSKKDVLFMKWFTGFVTASVLVSFLITVIYQVSYTQADALVNYNYWSFLTIVVMNSILYVVNKKVRGTEK